MAGHKKKVYQYTLYGELVKVWDSLTEASKSIGGHKECISMCALGKNLYSYGFIWLYSLDTNEVQRRLSKIKTTDNSEIEGEEWRDVVGYEGLYQVSNMGRVRTLIEFSRKKNKIILTPSYRPVGPNGRNGSYMMVALIKDGKYKTLTVHKLVAQAFLPNPDNLLHVNHKDEDKHNNCVENLEWCTPAYNNRYGSHLTANINNPYLSRPVNQYKDGVLVATYPSISEAKRVIGKRNISAVLKGTRKRCGGYEWKYADI